MRRQRTPKPDTDTQPEPKRASERSAPKQKRRGGVRPTGCVGGWTVGGMRVRRALCCVLSADCLRDWGPCHTTLGGPVEPEPAGRSGTGGWDAAEGFFWGL